MENCRVYAQSLLSDAAEVVTALGMLSDKRLTVPGTLMLQILQPEGPEHGISAIVMQLSN